MHHSHSAATCPARGRPALEKPRTAPSCFLLYDRHVEKNGGSTVRTLFKRLEEHGECAYWGYDISRASWQRTLTSLRELAQGGRFGALPKLCIESHCGAGTQSLAHLRQLGQLAPQLIARGCVVQRVLRVREPVSHYASFYMWARAIRENGVAAATNLTFVEWVRMTPNLQSSTLLNSHAATVAKQAPSRRNAADQAVLIASEREDDSQRWRRLLDAAETLFDLLVPLDRFEEGLLLLARCSATPWTRTWAQPAETS